MGARLGANHALLVPLDLQIRPQDVAFSQVAEGSTACSRFRFQPVGFDSPSAPHWSVRWPSAAFPMSRHVRPEVAWMSCAGTSLAVRVLGSSFVMRLPSGCGCVGRATIASRAWCPVSALRSTGIRSRVGGGVCSTRWVEKTPLFLGQGGGFSAVGWAVAPGPALSLCLVSGLAIGVRGGDRVVRGALSGVACVGARRNPGALLFPP
jgi:hypothetical protein